MRSNGNPERTCNYCGRRDHKLAVRFPDGTVEGYCPTCWEHRAGAQAEQAGAAILYDRRKK